MNKVKLFEKEKALLKNPEYIKDWGRLYTEPYDPRLLHEIKKNMESKNYPTPTMIPSCAFIEK